MLQTDGIYRENLLDILWEELPKDKTLANLNTCNYYLRKFSEKSQSGIISVHENGYYSLNLKNILVKRLLNWYSHPQNKKM